MTHMGIKLIDLDRMFLHWKKCRSAFHWKTLPLLKPSNNLCFKINVYWSLVYIYICNIVMLFDLGLTSSSYWTTCRLSVKFLNISVSFQGQGFSPCTSQNWVYPSVALFDGRTNYLHNWSPLCFNQIILILLAQFSK